MNRFDFIAALLALLLAPALAANGQAAPAPPQAPDAAKPRIQVSFLNSCHPAFTDSEDIHRALARLKERVAFTSDFVITRGVTTLSEEQARGARVTAEGSATRSPWVRIRRNFGEKAAIASVQYTFSVEGRSVGEILSLAPRDAHDVVEVLISSSVVGTPAQAIAADTPPERIRVERYGRSSLVLQRCGEDQTVYEPVFEEARQVFERYRSALGVKTLVPAELARLPRAKESKSPAGNLNK